VRTFRTFFGNALQGNPRPPHCGGHSRPPTGAPQGALYGSLRRGTPEAPTCRWPAPKARRATLHHYFRVGWPRIRPSNQLQGRVGSIYRAATGDESPEHPLKRQGN